MTLALTLVEYTREGYGLTTAGWFVLVLAVVLIGR